MQKADTFGGLFESSWSQKSENANKITSLDQSNEFVYVGYQNGTIDVFQIDVDGFKLSHKRSQQQAKNRRMFFSKNSIDSLREFNSYLLVISEGYLLCVDRESLDTLGKIMEKNCVSVAINEAIPSRILAVTKKKEILIFDFQESPFNFKQLDKKVQLQEIPAQIAFYKEKIIFTTSKKEYCTIDVNYNLEQKIFKDLPKSTQQPHFKVISEDEMLVVTSNNLGIFITLDGQPKQKNPLQLDSSKNIQQIHMIEEFMVVFYEGSLVEIFNVDDCTSIQQMDFGSKLDGGAVKFVTIFQNQNVLYFGSQTEIRNLYLVSFEDQLKKLLKQCEIESAQNLVEKHFSLMHPEREKKLQEFNVDACWSLLLQGRFDQAFKRIEDNFRYDIRQFIDNFSNEDDLNAVIEYIKKNSSSQGVSSGGARQSVGANSQQNRTSERALKQKILTFLVNLCLKNREHYKKYLRNQSQEFDFYISDFSLKHFSTSRKRDVGTSFMHAQLQQENFLKMSLSSSSSSEVRSRYEKTNDIADSDCNTLVKEILEQVEFHLINYLIMQNNEPELIAILSEPDNFCERLYDKLLQYLQAHYNFGDKSDLVMSRFYEHFMNLTDALKVWQVQLSSSEKRKESIANMARILTSHPKEKLVYDFLPEILKHSANSSYSKSDLQKLLSVLDPNKFPVFQIKQLIENTKYSEPEISEDFLGLYYEVLVNTHDYQDINIQNALAEYYTKFLFKRIPKSTPVIQFKEIIKPPLAKNETLSALAQEIVDKHTSLNTFIVEKNLYDAKHVLSLIQNSFLQESVIFLLLKLGRDEEALRLLIDQGEHDNAKRQCDKNQSKLKPIIFKIYLEKYYDLLAQSSLPNRFLSASQRAITHSASSVKDPSSVTLKSNDRVVLRTEQLFKGYLDDILFTFNYSKGENPFQILHLIPDEWVLSSSEQSNEEKDGNNENTALFEFLRQALSEVLHSKRQIQSTKYASECVLLKQKTKLLTAKKSYFTWYNDRKCAVCNKLIVNSTIFIVFPNGVIAHQSCVQKDMLHLCPETGQDFNMSSNY